jgi:hypothetical protein
MKPEGLRTHFVILSIFRLHVTLQASVKTRRAPHEQFRNRYRLRLNTTVPLLLFRPKKRMPESQFLHFETLYLK